jgi:hypothetical protein
MKAERKPMCTPPKPCGAVGRHRRDGTSASRVQRTGSWVGEARERHLSRKRVECDGWSEGGAGLCTNLSNRHDGTVVAARDSVNVDLPSRGDRVERANERTNDRGKRKATDRVRG